MTDQAAPARGITITFDGDSANPHATIAPDVTIGQLALAAWELGQMAQDARRGQLMAEAQQRQQVALVAAGLQQGRRA